MNFFKIMANEKEKKRKSKLNSMKKIMRFFSLEAKILNYLKSKK